MFSLLLQFLSHKLWLLPLCLLWFLPAMNLSCSLLWQSDSAERKRVISFRQGMCSIQSPSSCTELFHYTETCMEFAFRMYSSLILYIMLYFYIINNIKKWSPCITSNAIYLFTSCVSGIGSVSTAAMTRINDGWWWMEEWMSDPCSLIQK